VAHIYNPGSSGGRDTISRIPNTKESWQSGSSLPSKLEALSSNSSTTKKKRKEKKFMCYKTGQYLNELSYKLLEMINIRSTLAQSFLKAY
jgi:hypothetical protein